MGSPSPARERLTALATSVNGIVLTHDAFPQAILDVKQALDLTLEHPRDRDAGPARDDLGHVLRVDLLFEHLLFPLQLLELVVAAGELCFQLRQRAVAQLRGLLELAALGGQLTLDPGLLDLLFQGAQLGDCRFPPAANGLS